MPRNFTQSPTAGPLVVLQVIVEYVNLVIVNTTFSSFLHQEWSKSPLQKLVEWGLGTGGPKLLKGSSWLLWQMLGPAAQVHSHQPM